MVAVVNACVGVRCGVGCGLMGTYDEAQQVAEAEAAHEADQPLWNGVVCVVRVVSFGVPDSLIYQATGPSITSIDGPSATTHSPGRLRPA